MYSYRHGVPAEQTSWEVRKALLQREISTANCDVVCFQEVSSDSFDSDFSFMGDLGYDQSEMYKRGRFRPATFWKSARVEAVAGPMHRDRVLVIPFRRVRAEEEKEGKKEEEQGQSTLPPPPPPVLPDIHLPLYVANCHLQAGEQSAERRLRQMHDALESIRKEATKVIQLYLTSTNRVISSFKKAKKKQLQRSKNHGTDTDMTESAELALPWACQQSLDSILEVLPVVVLGDMNCDPNDHSAAHALLLHGEANAHGKVQATATATGTAAVSSSSSLKVKKQLLGRFIDVYAFAYASTEAPPPPTMICEHLYGVITDPLTPPIAATTATASCDDETQQLEGERHALSAMAVASLRGMFNQFASQTHPRTQPSLGEMVMGTGDIQRWLLTINLASNRGSERRAALSRLQRGGNDNSNSDGREGGESSLEDFPAESEGYFLDWEGFRSLYEETVNEGKVWSVSWDMAACGFPVNPNSVAVFAARYDRAYVSLGWMKQQQAQQQDEEAEGEQRVLVAVSELGVGSIAEGCLGVGGCLPNKHHPSDHLPIALALRL